MGTALMMEGLLSACYHVCPNYTNFQFGKTACVPTRTSIASLKLNIFKGAYHIGNVIQYDLCVSRV